MNANIPGTQPRSEMRLNFSSNKSTRHTTVAVYPGRLIFVLKMGLKSHAYGSMNSSSCFFVTPNY